MEHFKTVHTLVGTSYRLGEKLGIPTTEVSDITIDYGETPLVVTIWTKLDENHDEVWHVIIPYHAVELLVKK